MDLCEGQGLNSGRTGSLMTGAMAHVCGLRGNTVLYIDKAV